MDFVNNNIMRSNHSICELKIIIHMGGTLGHIFNRIYFLHIGFSHHPNATTTLSIVKFDDFIIRV